MLSAWLTGILGAALTYWVGSRYFGFNGWDTLLAVAVSNVAGFFALHATLILERRPKSRKLLLGNALKTWGLLATLYVLSMVALDPALRDVRALAALLAPLIWATGFMLPLWGPTQDRVIRWEQRRARRPRFSRNQQFARPERDAIRVES